MNFTDFILPHLLTDWSHWCNSGKKSFIVIGEIQPFLWYWVTPGGTTLQKAAQPTMGAVACNLLLTDAALSDEPHRCCAGLSGEAWYHRLSAWRSSDLRAAIYAPSASTSTLTNESIHGTKWDLVRLVSEVSRAGKVTRGRDADTFNNAARWKNKVF